MTAVLEPLRTALDRAADAGRTVRVWLRDDDCVAPTPALDRLAGLCAEAGLPVLLAVIPVPAEDTLAAWIAGHADVAPCQHGVSHANHAPPGARPIELGGVRPLAATLDDLARGRARLGRLFGARLSDILVPPWNRIDPALPARLPGLGYAALSTIAPGSPGGALRQIDCDLDIMDWRGGRIGRPLGEVAAAAAGIVARQDRLGLLTHHLAHDPGAWRTLAALIGTLVEHPAIVFVAADDLAGSSQPIDIAHAR